MSQGIGKVLEKGGVSSLIHGDRVGNFDVFNGGFWVYGSCRFYGWVL